MPTSLKTAASRAMDLYYQDYAPRDNFFDVDDFKFHFAKIYSSMFDSVFQLIRKANKAEDGFSSVEISAAWLVSEELSLKELSVLKLWVAVPTSQIFSFSNDEFVYALDRVTMIGDCNKPGHCKLVKISRSEAQFMDLSPTIGTTLYYVEDSNQIVFTSDIKKVSVSYIPAVDPKNDNCILSDNIVADVIKATLDIMFKSKDGNVVDETNDGNKNNVIGQQIDPKLTKIQQQ